MALVADIYGLSEEQAMHLTTAQTSFLLEKAQNSLATSAEVQSAVRKNLAPTLKGVLAAKAPVAAH